MIKIGLAQMNTQDKKQDNIASAEKLIDKLAGKGAQLIMLPEYFNFLGPDELKPENAEPLDGSESLAMIQRKARELKVHIHIGSYLERAGDHIYNTEWCSIPLAKSSRNIVKSIFLMSWYPVASSTLNPRQLRREMKS